MNFKADHTATWIVALCIAGIMISLIKNVAWLILNLGVDEFVAEAAVGIFSVINTRARKTILVDSISAKTEGKGKGHFSAQNNRMVDILHYKLISYLSVTSLRNCNVSNCEPIFFSSLSFSLWWCYVTPIQSLRRAKFPTSICQSELW